MTKYIKKNARNFVERITGHKTIQLTGKLDCVVVSSMTYKKMPIHEIAYQEKLNDKIKVYPICGIDQCIKHIKAEYNPKKEDLKYIKNWLAFDGIDIASQKLKIPKDLLEEYLKNHQD